jgi:hypothetical protein
MLSPEHYAQLPSFVLGFHGCDQSLADKVIGQDVPSLDPSENDYDWLGSGAYFWENNYARAMEWAVDMVGRERGPNKHVIHFPAVIGAVIDLGNCLNFLDQTSIRLAKECYTLFAKECRTLRKKMPRNVNPKKMAGSQDRIYRRLDRAVVEEIHKLVTSSQGMDNPEDRMPEFDTVRSVFLEGEKIYPHAGFLEKTHI